MLIKILIWLMWAVGIPGLIRFWLIKLNLLASLTDVKEFLALLGSFMFTAAGGFFWFLDKWDRRKEKIRRQKQRQ